MARVPQLHRQRPETAVVGPRRVEASPMATSMKYDWPRRGLRRQDLSLSGVITKPFRYCTWVVVADRLAASRRR